MIEGDSVMGTKTKKMRGGGKMKMAAKMRGGKVATKKMRGGGKMKVAAKRKGGRLY